LQQTKNISFQLFRNSVDGDYLSWERNYEQAAEAYGLSLDRLARAHE
jgi:hypothetical protein